MDRNTLRLIALAVLAVIGLFGWQQHRVEQARKEADQARRDKERAELKAGLDATRVIDLKFERTVQLGVRHLAGTMVTRTRADGCYGLCSSTQVTRAPFSVDYLVDLKRLPRAAYRWDMRDRVMFIEVPDVRVAFPNVDMARAQVEQDGRWISRDMGREMQQRAAMNLAAKATATAREPENLRIARFDAKIAVRDLAQVPLAAAGLGKVRIEVRLASDPKPVGYQPWDVSRSIEEVLADPRFRR